MYIAIYNHLFIYMLGKNLISNPVASYCGLWLVVSHIWHGKVNGSSFEISWQWSFLFLTMIMSKHIHTISPKSSHVFFPDHEAGLNTTIIFSQSRTVLTRQILYHMIPSYHVLHHPQHSLGWLLDVHPSKWFFHRPSNI